jgi:hypothetical protein
MVIAGVSGVRPSQAQTGTVVFQDDFTVASLDSTKWGYYDSSSSIHNTWFGKAPTFGTESGNGFMRLNLDTYNPDAGKAGTFKGTELFTRAVFPIGAGGVEYEARIRGTNIPAGAVFAFYTFGAKGVWPTTYLWDEVDFELLGNYTTDRVWLNIWDDYNPERGGPNEASQPNIAGLNWKTWNVFRARVYPYVTQFFINNVLVRQSYNITPTDPMGIHFNIWVPNNTWTAAYSSSLPPGTSTSKATYYFDVDYAKVRNLSAGSVGTGTGLAASYYDNANLTGATVSRTDPEVNFNWGTGSPATAIGADTFSARWTGQVQAQFTETYTFTTNSDDGVRLWVNGQKLVDNWTDHGPTENSGSIALVAGAKYSIVMEYYDGAFGAISQLFWSSPSTPRRTVPKQQLYPGQVVSPTPTPTPTKTPTPTPTPTATPTAPPGSGTGLSATYYDNVNFTGAIVTRVDPQINFDWGNGSPAAAIGVDTYSARWTGQVQPQYTQTYTFYALADDGVRVWVNGVKLIDAWKDQGPTEYSGSIALTAAVKYNIVVEYYEGGFGAVAQLRWSSPSTPKAIVPQNRLYPAQVVTPTPTPTPTATPTATPPPTTGTGLAATYYDNVNFTGATVSRVEPQINFDWGNGSPAAAIGVDTFSARWTGQVQPQYTQTYTFYALADDGVRVWVNGTRIIDGWKDQGPTEYSGSIALTAAVKYNIVVEYYENGFGALAQLRWSSPSTPKAIVPQSRLFPAQVATPALMLASPPISPFGISTGTASSGSNIVRLTFSGALDGKTVADTLRYIVRVNGVSADSEAVSYSGSTVTLVPVGRLDTGAAVEVSWSGLRDYQGRPLKDGVWRGKAN